MPYGDELIQFKTSISLTEFAGDRGYFLDKKESSRNSIVMRHFDGDKIIISKKGLTWVYFSVRDNHDNGTIIDFLQHRGAGNLGDIRKILREWMGTSRNQDSRKEMNYPEPVPLARNRKLMKEKYSKATICNSTPYLTTRGLKENPRFHGCMAIDDHRNTLFPHYDDEGLCGYEVKNKGFTGFAPGGVKGLWWSNNYSSDDHLVICESAIDAMSYQAIFNDENTRYISIAGEINPTQPGLILKAIENLPEGSTVVFGLDNDDGGRNILNKLRDYLKNTLNKNYKMISKIPCLGKDWNEMLLNTPSSSKEDVKSSVGQDI